MSVEVIDQILDHVPSAEFRALVVLARYGGLRCPSEVLPLTWDKVDWEREVLHVRSPKTEGHVGQDWRSVPMFPEVRKALSELWEQAEDGEPLLLPRFQEGRSTMTRHLAAAAERAGVELWQKP